MSITPWQQRWLEVIPLRRARRSFRAEPSSPDALDALDACTRDFRPFGDAVRAILMPQVPQQLFMGIVGSYGGVSGASSALAFVGVGEERDVRVAVGYTGEGLVLEATALGLDTCWVGGLFSTKHAVLLGDVAEGERVYAVSPVGYAAEHISTKERIIFGMGHPKFRRELGEIAAGIETWPTWARAGVEAARIAPSAMNRQPWRFRLDADGVVVSVAEGVDTPRVSKRLDCGIAMLHFELGARGAGNDGVWEFLEAPDVARWLPVS